MNNGVLYKSRLSGWSAVVLYAELQILRTTEMSSSGKSSFREEYCPSHLQVEWKVSYEILQKSGDALRSPVFKIGRQSYMLESKQSNTDGVELFLLRMGPSISDGALEGQFWGGLKRTDGDYDLIYESKQSDLKCEFISFNKEASFWISFTTDLDSLYLTPDGCLIFFLRMNVKRPLVGVETCIHGTSPMPNPEAGSIRQEECSHHQHVEWNISYAVQQDDEFNLTSPVFKIGTQMYFFQLSAYPVPDVTFHLFRLGRSVDGPASDVRYWIGLRCVDGTYHPKNFSDILDLSEDFGLWTEVHRQTFYGSDLEKLYLTLDRRLTFFFIMNVDSTGADLCRHDTSDEIVPQATGNIQEEQCSSHKQVEWEIGYKVPQDRPVELRSPVFKIGTQAYFLEICIETHGRVGLHLFRIGRCVRGPASTPQCWVGLRRMNGTYYHEKISKQVDLREDFWLWTHLDFLKHIWGNEVREWYLTPDSKLTFLFRMNTETTGPQMCTHGLTEMLSSVTGRIRKVGCSSHKEVEWDIDCEVLREHNSSLKSPVFKVDSQMYYLELVGKINYNAVFVLYRLGRSVEGPASSFRCWAGLKYPDGSYPLRNASRKLDLHDDFALWTFVTSFMQFTDVRLDENALKYMQRLIFFIRMNVEPPGTEKCIHGAVEMCPPGEGSIRERNENLVEWDVGYEEPREYTHFSTSPVFKMGIQRYLLDLCYETDGILALSLYRSGRSVEVPVRCWAGLKRDRGMYHHDIEGVELDLRRDCELWTKVRILGNFRRCDLEDECLAKNGRLTFFCLINAEGRESKAVAVQMDGNSKYGHEDRLFRHSEDFKKLRQDFRLWLEHPEEGDRIRLRRREEFEAKRSNVLEKQLKEDKEPSILAA